MFRINFYSLLLVFALFIAAQSGASPLTRVVVLGDSLSAAYNIPQNKGWVNLLQNSLTSKQLDVKIINAAVSGETTTGGLARLPKLLARHQPQVLIIELGGNDGLRGFNLEYTRANLRQMLKLAVAKNIQVLLCEIDLPPNYGQKYRQAFRQIYHQLAAEYDAVLVPFFLADIATKKGMMQADGIHPTAQAQPHISQVFERYLLPLIGAHNKAS